MVRRQGDGFALDGLDGFRDLQVMGLEVLCLQIGTLMVMVNHTKHNICIYIYILLNKIPIPIQYTTAIDSRESTVQESSRRSSQVTQSSVSTSDGNYGMFNYAFTDGC